MSINMKKYLLTILIVFLGIGFASSVSATAWDITTLSFTTSTSVGSQDGIPTGITFKSDGTKMFMVGADKDKVYEYSLSSAWDITTLSFTASSSIESQDGSPQGLDFNTDGTKMFMAGTTNDSVYEYSLSSAWNITTLNFTASSSITTQDNIPQGITFKSDGTKMFMTGYNTRRVFEYSLSSAWDITTLSFTTSTSVGSQDTSPQNITFNTDGTKMFMAGTTNDSVYEYSLSSAWDITTLGFTASTSVVNQDIYSQDIAFKDDGTKMFMVGTEKDNVNEYFLPEAETGGQKVQIKSGSIQLRSGKITIK